jgi:hypothetical protein
VGGSHAGTVSDVGEVATDSDDTVYTVITALSAAPKQFGRDDTVENRKLQAMMYRYMIPRLLHRLRRKGEPHTACRVLLCRSDILRCPLLRFYRTAR